MHIQKYLIIQTQQDSYSAYYHNKQTNTTMSGITTYIYIYIHVEVLPRTPFKSSLFNAQVCFILLTTLRNIAQAILVRVPYITSIVHFTLRKVFLNLHKTMSAKMESSVMQPHTERGSLHAKVEHNSGTWRCIIETLFMLIGYYSFTLLRTLMNMPSLFGRGIPHHQLYSVLS